MKAFLLQQDTPAYFDVDQGRRKRYDVPPDLFDEGSLEVWKKGEELDMPTATIISLYTEPYGN